MHPSRIVALVGAGTALIVCTCIAAFAWLLSISAASLDRNQQDGERRLLRSVIDDYQTNLAQSVADYSSWTELYDNFEKRRNAAWEKGNLGPYVAQIFGMSRMLVTAKDGSIVYSYAPGMPPISEGDKRVLRALTQREFYVRRPGVQVPIVGVVEIGGMPCITAASFIRDSTTEKLSTFSVIFVRRLGPQFLGKLAHNYGLKHLAVIRHGQMSGLALLAPDKVDTPYALLWQPSAAGRRLLTRAFPALIVIGVTALLAILGLIFACWKLIGHIRDSEARILRAELETSDARAEAAEETSRGKSAFIANMSHELRTPLNAIIGFSELISSEAFGPIGVKKYREYVGDILSSGRHLLKLVEEILQVSKIEAGKYEPPIAPISLTENLNHCMRMIEVLAAKKKLSISTALVKEADVILADQQALRQILLNVLSNAVKFSPVGGQIEILCRPYGEESELIVTDHGCGIPPETLNEIGKPFVQAEGVYSRKHDGTGLGLAICFMLAEAVHAAIHIDSTVGAGTSVRIRLPIAPAAVAVVAA